MSQVCKISRSRARTSQLRVTIGCGVILEEVPKGSRLTVKLAKAMELSADEPQISTESPLGKALLGRCPGDQLTVQTPSGKIRFRVVEVKPPSRNKQFKKRERGGLARVRRMNVDERTHQY